MIEPLSPRELQVVRLLCDGLTAKEIAARLHISAKTVDVHRTNATKKLGVHGIAQLVRWAIRHGVVEA